MQPHQERVIAERDELNVKLDKLTEFLKGSMVSSLPLAEQERLTRQHTIMSKYSSVLAERIAAF